jgi:hypothetical protein
MFGVRGLCVGFRCEVLVNGLLSRVEGYRVMT